MPPFLHQREREFEEVLRSSDTVLRACLERDIALVELASRHLEEARAAYGRVGIPDAENHALGLLAQVAEARGGVNPLTHERVPTRRREMQRTVVLHAVLENAERLRADYGDVRSALGALRERLTPLALFALQKGFVPDVGGRSLTQAELDAVWQKLCDDADSRPATRQLAMFATPIDVLLVLGELLDAVRPPSVFT
jgi:hypothetical protein